MNNVLDDYIHDDAKIVISCNCTCKIYVSLGSYELQYLFLIPTDIDKQLLLSDLPST